MTETTYFDPTAQAGPYERKPHPPSAMFAADFPNLPAAERYLRQRIAWLGHELAEASKLLSQIEAWSSPRILDRVAWHPPSPETPLERLELSVRSARELERIGCRTLGDVAALTEARLLRVPGCGRRMLGEVKSLLKAAGLSLAG